MKRLRVILAVAAVVLGVAVATAFVASLSRGPSTPPLAVHVPDVAFSVPGVRSFVTWEAKRDARRAVQNDQALLLGYLHHHDVGDLDDCVWGDYQESVENEGLPNWLGYTADGVLAIECNGSPNSIAFQVPVLECGNPSDEYQVVYGRAFNNEIVRLVRSSIGGEGASNKRMHLTVRYAARR